MKTPDKLELGMEARRFKCPECGAPIYYVEGPANQIYAVDVAEDNAGRFMLIPAPTDPTGKKPVAMGAPPIETRMYEIKFDTGYRRRNHETTCKGGR